MTFRLLHSETDAAFQPTAKARLQYVYIMYLFVWGASPRSRAVAICPTGMKVKTMGVMPYQNGLFFCDNRYIIIALSQLFNDYFCIDQKTHTFVGINTSVGWCVQVCRG